MQVVAWLDSGENSTLFREVRGQAGVARILEGVVSLLQKHPVLRISRLCLAAGDVKKKRIKLVSI